MNGAVLALASFSVAAAFVALAITTSGVTRMAALVAAGIWAWDALTALP
jgi:hypothetical protein